MTTAPTDIDGRYSQGWGGLAPNGVHVNVLLARRGSATAAAMTNAFTAPSAGFTPVLASLGKTQPEYVTLYPPTILMPKSNMPEGMPETLIFGAAPVGTAQAVLDVVAEGLLEATQDTIVFVSIWIDSAATDETLIKNAMREAVSFALREAVLGRTADEAAALVADRENIGHPFYGGN